MADIRRVWPEGEAGVRLAECMGVFVLATVVCYSDQGSIYHALTGPIGHRPLVAFTPNEAFTNTLMMALLGGLIAAVPVATYTMCARRQTSVRPLLLALPLLYAAGLGVGWFVAVPFGLQHLTGFDTNTIHYLPRASDYIQFTMLTLLGSGVAFGLPAAWALRESS
jgi:Sec-independent protein secretion pathway component TatC